MKKFYILFVMISFAFVSRGTIVSVSVSDNVFTPNNFTVSVGDTIMWMWVNGTHTTTSTAVPNGAASWDQVINQNTPMFTYVPAIAGAYNYQCTFHVSMGMVGQFTVEQSSGISENISGVSLKLFAINHELNIDLKSSRNGEMRVALNDLTGREVKLLTSNSQSSGNHHMEFNVADLPRGLYFVKITLGNDELVRKIIL